MRVEEERMKESGMEKLIELLNEYQEGKGSEIRFKRIDNSDFFVCGDDVGLGYETILSKKFGFIKRLVDNDKIAYRRCLDLWYEISVIDEEGEDIDVMRTFDSYEKLLMYLAIQDNPIEFLISILK